MLRNLKLGNGDQKIIESVQTDLFNKMIKNDKYIGARHELMQNYLEIYVLTYRFSKTT